MNYGRSVMGRARGRRVVLMLIAIVVCTFEANTAASGQLFAARFCSYNTGDRPISVAIGDLNGDGRLDLTTANGGTVSVLLGNGDGTFGANSDFDAGGNANAVAIADINADGLLDLATPASVLLGNGDGTFQGKIELATGSLPFSVAIADFNEDGRLDIAVANPSANTVSVLLGSGDGTFGAKADFATGSIPYSVASADLNGDGRPDLVVPNAGPREPGVYGNTVSVLLGNGDGTFGLKTDFEAGSSPRSVTIGDLNSDGRPDLVVANERPTMSVLLGNGDGTFEASIDTGTKPSNSVAIGDLNGDGRVDLAATNFGTVSVLLGNGDGTFGANIDSGAGYEPCSVAIGDLNGDDRPDLATADGFSTTSVLLGNGDGTFGTNTDVGARCCSIAIGDLNADGQPDLATSGSVLLGNGDGTFGAGIDTGAPSSNAVAMGDLNNDGRPDLATPGWVLLGNGDGTFGPPISASNDGYSVVIGDLNADGRRDLVTVNGFNAVSVLLGNGDGTFRASTIDLGEVAPVAVTIADLNVDGRADLVVANYRMGSVSVLLGNGDGTFGTKMDLSVCCSPYSIAVGDLNGDGRSDLAVADSYGDILNKATVPAGLVNDGNRIADGAFLGRASVLLGNGDGTFGTETQFETGSSPTSVAIADLDVDGQLDLALANGRDGTVSVLLGNGDGTFRAKTDFGVDVWATSVAIGDLNADGRPELVVAGGGVSVLLNLGRPICPPTTMTFDLSPSTFNLRSMGRWVTGMFEPEPPASPADIDLASILLRGNVPVEASGPTSIGDVDQDGRPDLTVKFDREALELAVDEGDAVPVTVTGKIGHGCFTATDVIAVRRGHVTAPAAGSVILGGSPVEVRWDTPLGVQVQSVAILFSADDGTTWNLDAHELPNSGSYTWTVPAAGTNRARVAVVLVESEDMSGLDVEGVVAMSGRFTVTSAVGVGHEGVSFALRGAVPNPSGGLDVSFGLPSEAPATLAVFDVSGRQVISRQVGSYGPGWHAVKLGEVPAGTYIVRLSQAGYHLSSRAVVIR